MSDIENIFLILFIILVIGIVLIVIGKDNSVDNNSNNIVKYTAIELILKTLGLLSVVGGVASFIMNEEIVHLTIGVITGSTLCFFGDVITWLRKIYNNIIIKK